MNDFAILKIADGEYINDSCERNVIRYILNFEKTNNHLIRTRNIYANGPESIITQFENVNLAYNNEGKKLWHFILSMKRNGIICEYDFTEVVEFLIGKLPEHQIVAAIHTNSKTTIHAHIVMSHINFMTGRKFSMPYSYFNNIENEVNAYIYDLIYL